MIERIKSRVGVRADPRFTEFNLKFFYLQTAIAIAPILHHYSAPALDSSSEYLKKIHRQL
jgi:hypothetical protein